MEEITYGPVDDDGNPIDEGAKKDLTTSGIVNLHVVEKAMRICRRTVHPFHDVADKNKWLRIDKQISKGTIPMPWVENCFEWAREMNKERLIIMMPSLASLIINKARMTDWLGRQDKDPDATAPGVTKIDASDMY